MCAQPALSRPSARGTVQRTRVGSPIITIGNVDSPHQATVDPGGTLAAAPGWRLGWWVRASDRWHEPSTSVSQRRVDAAPVVETAMRVPGGHAVHTAWCAVAAGGGEWAVVEVENRSPEPVAVALVVDTAGTVTLDDAVVRVDGRSALVLPRLPSRCTATPDDGGGDTVPRRHRGRMGFVFPLAHTARVRAAVPLDATSTVVDLAALPDAERVARGWLAHAEPPGSLRAVLPDSATTESLVAARAALLVEHDDPSAPMATRAAALDALDRCGHHDLVGGWLPPLLLDLRRRRWEGAGRLLVAAAGHHRRTRRPLDDELLGVVAQAAHKLRRRGRGDPWTGPGQLAAAELLDTAGQADAAARCRELVTDPAPAPPPDEGAAGRVIATLDRLVVDTDDGVALLPGLLDEWLGQGVEVHDAPTRFGPLSYAVRWHGARPAVLWHAERDIRLTAPRLDNGWSTHQAKGEALLSPVEPAGGLPKVVAPLGHDGTPAGAAPAEGGTFA